VRLIRGAPGAGKTARVFQEFRDALPHRRATLRIVVPTATLVRHFQHELARAGLVFPPSSVLSLRRFIAEQAPGLKPVPDGLLRATVRDALHRLKPAGFEEVSETDGMVSTILEAIGLFENAGATPEKLAAVRRLTPHARAFESVWRAVAAAVRARGFASRTELLRAAAAGVRGLRVWMDGFVAFSPLETELVRALAHSCDLTLTLTDSPAGDDIRRLALHLGAEDRLLPGSARRPQIQAVEANSIEREADEIARRILALHERGTPFREIGVALHDQPSYVPLLRGVFERFGIPARFYFSAPLRHHPAAIFLGGLIENALAGWEFGSTLDTLRAHPAWGAGASFDWFDFAVREAMPGRGAEDLVKHCDNEKLSSRIRQCLAVAPWARETQAPADWARRFEQLASALYQPGVLVVARDRAALETQRSHVAALAAWTEAVESVTAFWPDAAEPVSLEEFWRAASEAIEAATVQTRDDRRDVVHVMSVYEARQWDVAALFVCGVTDRDFPKKHPRNLLFPDPDIDALRKAGIPLRKASDIDREEEFLFDALRTRARSSLVLSWPSHDAAGKTVQWSRFCAAGSQPARLCRPEPRVIPGPAGVAGRVDSPALLAALAAQHQRISLTALEDLAQCRFKFFARRTLRLEGRPERPGERLKPLVTGLILHDALEAWLKNNRQGEFVPLFEAAFNKTCFEKHLPPGYRLEVERIQLRKIAESVGASEKWTPLSSDAEVEVALDFPGGITVTGRIDRIDRIGDRDCIIVDYKSSRTARVEQMVESAVKLQGPLYALAARERLHLNTVAMMYHAVREDKRFGWGAVPGLDLNLKPMPLNWIEDARSRTIERISDFLGGAIQADPAERDQCRWCDFAQACRYTETQALVMVGSASAGAAAEGMHA
jgi:ATP-dependent helicase/DNAse subunit B